jgi:uncharacterized protein YxjI
MNLRPDNVTYTLKRRMQLLGQGFTILDQAGGEIGVVAQKAFKLREDIRVYSDLQSRREILAIRARQIMDFQAAYDVWDPEAGMKVGAMRRKGWSSLIRDEWEVMDAADNVIGKLHEDNMALALVRRFLSNLIPQNFDMVMYDGRKVVDYRQAFNPFFYSLTVDFSMDPQASLDRRLGLAGGILIACIEGRQAG